MRAGTMPMCFICNEPSGRIRRRVAFWDHSIPIASPGSWDEVRILSARHRKVLLLGLFGWSNWSHWTLRDILKHASLFEAHQIGLSAFCLGDEAVIEAICPEFLPHWRTLRTEPAMLKIEGGSLTRVRGGPVSAFDVLSWLSWDGLDNLPVLGETFGIPRETRE